MARRTPAAAAASAALALLAAPGPARASSAPTIYDNYQSFPVGSRSAGMGGAYTALACDEGALHYNPASLGCALASRLELTANAYVLHHYDVPDAFGEGEDISAITYHSLPSIVGGVRILREGGEPDPGTGSRAGRLAFGLSVSVPNSIALQVDPANPTKPSHLAFSVRDALTAGDIGLGYQINRYLGVGLSVGGVVRTYEFRITALLAAENPSPCGFGEPAQCTSFFAVLDDIEGVAVGARARLGLRFTPTRALSFGLAVTSPAVDIYTGVDVSRLTTLAFSAADAAGNVGFVFGAAPVRLHGLSDVGTPLRLALGAAYSTPRFTASLDASLNLPRDVRMAHDLEAQRIEGVATPEESELEDVVRHYALQPNVNLGVEIGLTDSLLLNFGGFTDLSAVSSEDHQEQSIDRIHLFGGSAAIGLLGRRSRAWFGASFEYGRGESLVVSGGQLTLEEAIQNDLEEDGRSTATRWTLVGILGSSYSFMPGD